MDIPTDVAALVALLNTALDIAEKPDAAAARRISKLRELAGRCSSGELRVQADMLLQAIDRMSGKARLARREAAREGAPLPER